mmetsp:Transcript_8595/g.26483  ORF Transcript_8595/g.26483 Transcript_8595/m.26483 type:complete len:1239 (-) Transcript_8595:80-3796(-)
MSRTWRGCVECPPDTMQQPGAGDQCDLDALCPLGERRLGSDECTQCMALRGTYVDTVTRDPSDPTSWSAARCKPCAPGSYADGSSHAVDECFKCLPGTYQNGTGSDACSECPAGQYQQERGATSCEECVAGGYCDDPYVVGGGFTACPAGTFNSNRGSSAPDACEPCPAGTYNPSPGATSSDACRRCRRGTYASDPGQVECAVCSPGAFQPREGNTSCVTCEAGMYCPDEGASSQLACPGGTFSMSLGSISSGTCQPCPAGTSSNKSGSASPDACQPCDTNFYKPTEGAGNCIPCPFPLGAGEHSESCIACRGGFYLNADATAAPSWEDMRNQPDAFCLDCPLNGSCPFPTTLAALVVPLHYWRDSNRTASLYKCAVDPATDRSACRGSTPLAVAASTRSSFQPVGGGFDEALRNGPYCEEGHAGPLCQQCTQPSHYFDRRSTKLCQECPSTAARIGILMAVLAGVFIILTLIYVASKRVVPLTRLAQRLSIASTTISFQAKFKIAVGFYQVVVTLSGIYGVRLDRRFTSWFSIFDLNLTDLSLPAECIGTMRARLLVGALWPYAAVALLVLTVAVTTILSRRARTLPELRTAYAAVWERSVYAFVLVVYLALPSVTRSIFLARECVSYDTDDLRSQRVRRSYLLADLSMSCSAADRKLSPYFWSLFVLWPVLVPLVLLVLVLAIRPAVRAQRHTALVEATRFLWRDYTPGMLFWEVLDTVRRLWLTALILFVDTEYGARKFLRLIIGAIVSAMYLTILALARPYKRQDDLYLACLSNLLLACCFCSGMAIKLCDEDDGWAETCYGFTSFTTGYLSTVFVTGLTLTMLVCAIGVIAINTVSAAAVPTFRLASTGREPLLDLPKECSFHAFISHAWGTGQDQTHSVVRKLQLTLPAVKIWLDVDNLNDVGKLEEAVRDSAVFVIFLSQGYFRSANCRRELYAALVAMKPIVTIREDDVSRGGASVAGLIEECRHACTNDPLRDHPELGGTEGVISAVFAQSPIVWARVHDFQVQSLKCIIQRILTHLPYYCRHPDELTGGLTVRGELGKLGFSAPTRIIVCASNAGAREVAGELADEVAFPASVERPTVLVTHEVPKPTTTRDAVLLYLNEGTFVDADGALTAFVKQVIEAKMSIAMLHEQCPSRGACPFGILLGQTPRELQAPPYSLYDSLAVPLYPSAEHRPISLRHALLSIGARPVHARDRHYLSALRATRVAISSAKSMRHSRPEDETAAPERRV